LRTNHGRMSGDNLLVNLGICRSYAMKELRSYDGCLFVFNTEDTEAAGVKNENLEN
jgi:hypothetical protein